MGLHKLEIEVTDELLSRIDSVSARNSHSRVEVVVETLEDNLPMEKAAGSQEVEERLAFLEEMFEQATKLGIQRPSEDILREVREFRGDE